MRRSIDRKRVGQNQSVLYGRVEHKMGCGLIIACDMGLFVTWSREGHAPTHFNIPKFILFLFSVFFFFFKYKTCYLSSIIGLNNIFYNSYVNLPFYVLIANINTNPIRMSVMGL